MRDMSVDQTLETFRTKFYALVPARYVAHMDEDARAGAARAFWSRAGTRPRGAPLIRAYNPVPEVDGWSSPHSVVEIITDDMPFLVDSVTAGISSLGHDVHLVIHPIIRVKRDAAGALAELVVDDEGLGPPAPGVTLESCMHLQVSRQTEPALSDLEDTVQGVLDDVRTTVADWREMLARATAATDWLRKAADGSDETAETVAFLDWLIDDNFTFLGWREIDFHTGGDGTLSLVRKPGLGLLRDPAMRAFDDVQETSLAAGEVRDFVLNPPLLSVTKANRRSTVHRPVHLDTITIRRNGTNGTAAGVYRLVGLFTSTAYQQSVRTIPLIRRRVSDVIARARFRGASHNFKALVNILETFPRDELFQCTADELFATATGMLNIQGLRDTAVFTRVDALERFVSCIALIPRDRYDTRLRERASTLLAGSFGGTVAAYYTQMTDSPHARLHVIVKTTPGRIPAVDHRRLEDRVQALCRSWSDQLRETGLRTLGEEKTLYLLERYATGFPLSYQETASTEAALLDMQLADRVEQTGVPQTRLYRPSGAQPSIFHLILVRARSPLPLSDILPVLENMGLRVIAEAPHRIANQETGALAWLHDFRMERSDGGVQDLGAIDARFREGLARVMDGTLENDGFNRLILAAGFDWREVSVIRAYARYLRQIGTAFSHAYMMDTLADNPQAARLLIDLFLRRFDPRLDRDRDEDCARLVTGIEETLNAVENLDEDRILRLFLDLVQNTLRTGYFRPALEDAPGAVSFKLDSRRISSLPDPRPMVEIWICSPQLEAVHLRGGEVARGGIRWSDRREDFRTEVLGLMKAQMTKNSVIVPVGSKGGFVVKQPPAGGGREAFLAEGVRCYRIMMRIMLDITDSFRGTEVIAPSDVVRRDGDDPYLVVAADKGTATFSDIANAVAQDYDFWLDDAFASGGSAGYDHKGMGITARGAWESVKRHFREIGTDIQTTAFTAVGCGDMSGDVFGNGMLLSRHTRLLGAFNHLHIFIDPDPEPEAAWHERRRLFDLPRSSWIDYDSALLSSGGGVFDRSAKSITTTREMRALFDIEADTVTPSELIRAMLAADVDLLWFGGIGTYVKGRAESHEAVGDRSNDELRVDGREVRARVIGEGANLGVTQLGRIEYAQSGGHINTDAIDNSGGVACSDREVNIKILLGTAMEAGGLSREDRDRLLAEMTDDVAALVLKDNYDQSQALSMAEAEGAAGLDAQVRLMRRLERGPLELNRRIEFLPDEEALAERAAAGTGLTRPEVAVLMAYAKMELYDELLGSDLPDDPALEDDLVAYFPAVLGERFPDAPVRHRLRREIIATYLANSMINRVGPTFVNTVRERTGDGADEITRAYIIARDVFGIRRLWRAVEALDNRVPAAVQTAMLLALRQLTDAGVAWMLDNRARPLDLASGVADHAAGIGELRDVLDEVSGDFIRRQIAARSEEWEAAGVPRELARDVAAAAPLARGCDVVALAAETGIPVGAVARTHFAVGDHFGIDRLCAAARSLPASSQWDTRAAENITQDITAHQYAITRSILATGEATSIEAWLSRRPGAVERTQRLLDDLAAMPSIDLAVLSVASSHFRALTEATSP